MSLTAIDFEASCLPRHGRSYPIEVGIADERGARSWLIRPEPEWRGWDWTERAARLHGIRRDVLDRDGLPARRVAAELATAVAGRRLVADSQLDAGWLATLAEAGGSPPLPRIEHVADVMAQLGTRDEEIATAWAALERQDFRRHHARDDACWLHALIERLRAVAGARAGCPGAPLFAWSAPPPSANHSQARHQPRTVTIRKPFSHASRTADP